ncbi:hypothetical protein [Clostridium estertheticum]|uniref:hypothetical protein n=1 Tax=Clostridium estertheticum TaxID=238834 RepID=UPI001CF4CEBF|nr:hypothetical protein [Clostridium estertheticum]MCB2354481.1 hypothetical protein [Clostridium estertheticum]WAG42406.1 hypothetical protein LL065_06940 [Clostridium estertheticum]
MNTRLEDIQRHIDEGLKIPGNEPITRQYFWGNRKVNVTFYFGTKTQEQINEDVYEVIKRDILIENGVY